MIDLIALLLGFLVGLCIAGYGLLFLGVGAAIKALGIMASCLKQIASKQ